MVIISKTAEQHGFGSDPYKWVSYLSGTEKIYVKRGGLVLFRSSRLSGGNNGTYWRRVIYKNGRYLPRTVEPNALKMLGLSD